MINKKIPYARHLIEADDKKSVMDALEGEWLTTGPLVEEFEGAIRNYCGVEATVVSSGTAALHSIFSSLNLKTCDEVITPPNTFVATQSTAILSGAKVRFADVQSDTGNIDPESVKSLISSRTKAIVAVDFAGHPADLSELREIAHDNGAILIEDAAHSFGSTYRGQKIGSLADVTAFSFFATKNLTTGEGGAVATKDLELMRRIRQFSRQGIVRDNAYFQGSDLDPWFYEVQQYALNYRLPDILCALGISQLRKIEQFKDFRRRLFEKYVLFLSKFEALKLPAVRSYVDPIWHLFPIQVPRGARKEIYMALHEVGIKVQVNYIPAYWHPVFDSQDYPRGLCPVAENFYGGEISLPMYVDDYLLSEEYFARLERVFSRYG